MAVTRATVLIVDDEPHLRDVVAEGLEPAGFEPLVAGSVVEAIGVLADMDIDVVLTDVRMPGADGTELARHVCERYPRVGVVFMSGSAEPSVVREFDGAVFVRKPFTIDEIAAAIDHATRR